MLLSGQLIWGQSEAIWINRQATDLNIDQAAILHSFTDNFRMVELEVNSLAPTLLSKEKTTKTVTLPLPDGSETTVQITPVSVMAPGLAARYPDIQTYQISPKGKTIYGGRVGWTAQGLHATIRTHQGTVYIDPYARHDNRYYAVYNVEGNIQSDTWSQFECGVAGENDMNFEELFPTKETIDKKDKSLLGASTVQHRYRLAMAATGEYSVYHGGDNPSLEISLGALVIVVNRINEVFGRDIGIQLELIEEIEEIIYLDPDTDPYLLGSVSQEDLTGYLNTRNPEVINNTIGTLAYDIGHVVSTRAFGVGGLAALESVCTGNKASASSTIPNPVGDPFSIALISHEMGHQFGGTHTQSGCQNVDITSSVEPGGGTTIMGYAGICPAGYNVQSFTDDYFNNSSLVQMINYSREANGDVCAEKIDEANTLPEVALDYENGFFIPISTPFELKATATDMEDDNLTYCWEQSDINPSIVYDDENDIYGPQPGSPEGNSPLFRSLQPTAESNRVFPRLELIVNNIMSDAEVLPTYDRPMSFRCTVRDNHPTSGGIDWQEVEFRATEEAGPFLVTSPNTFSAIWTVGDYTEVTWDVANTDGAVVDCQRVNIRLSTDGGFTYPITLLEDTPNSGSAFVTVPDEVGTLVRVRVEAANNIFFDISDNNFNIQAATEPGYTVDYTPLYQELCIPQESGTIELTTSSILGYDEAISFEVLSSFPDGISASFAAESVQPGESNSLIFDFDDTSFDGPLTVDFQITAAGQEPSTRSLDLLIRNNNFSALSLLSPLNGTVDLGLQVDFDWNDLPNANLYDIEIADSPTFGTNVVDAAYELSETSFSPDVQFESNTLYFWRVRAINDCGPGAWSVPSTFQTEVTICEGEVATDVPIIIPPTGPLPTVESKIFIDFDGVISDINIPNLRVRYSPVQNVEIRLISPDEETVTLYGNGGECFGTGTIDVGFDDEAPTTIECPPDNGNLFQPLEPLSMFINEGTQGEWTLQVEVLETGFGIPGGIDNWEIEFCAEGTPSAPNLVTNMELCIPPGATDEITSNLLLVNDDDQGAPDLEYMLVTLPSAGTLYLNDTELVVGSTFSQSFINAGFIRYENDDNTATSDNFNFVVQDGTGGHLEVTQFEILLDASCVVNTENIASQEPFKLYPNPSNGEFFLEWGQALVNNQVLRVYNIQGQLIQQSQLNGGTLKTNVDLSNQPAGIYIVQVGAIAQRVIVE